MAAAAILNFQKFKILTVDPLKVEIAVSKYVSRAGATVFKALAFTIKIN